MGNLNFNVQQESADELQSSYDDTPIPPGIYKVEISQGVIGDNKAGTGQWLRVHFTILEGAQRNQEFVTFFNIQHVSEKAEKIAREELSRLCRVVGIDGTLDDSEDLHGLELIVDLDIEQGKDGIARNRVKKYMPLPAEAAPASAPAAPANGARPWAQ